MKKAKFVVIIDAECLRDQQVCKTGDTENADAWEDISVHGYLGIIEWNENDVEGLLDFEAENNELSRNILTAIKI